jgi:hypothetical protein
VQVQYGPRARPYHRWLTRLPSFPSVELLRQCGVSAQTLLFAPFRESQLLETGFLAIFACPLWSLDPLPPGLPMPQVGGWMGSDLCNCRCYLLRGSDPCVRYVRAVSPGLPMPQTGGDGGS